MRSQRRTPQTVQVLQVVSTEDALGNISTATTTTTVSGAIFEPERQLERAGNDQVPVLQPAVWNLPVVLELNSDDRIVHGDDVWEVLGGSALWLDRTKVPVQQTRET